MQQLTVLGSTGSIGVSTLAVVALHPDLFRIYALSCHSAVEKLLSQCLAFKPQYAVVVDEQKSQWLSDELAKHNSSTQVLSGSKALEVIASDTQVDTVMAAIVGSAGLLATLAAVKSGKKVLLANKESLVMAGQLFMNAVAESGAILLPVDSEHNAIFQCMDRIGEGENLASLGVEKILLTGSGGPFLNTPIEQMAGVTVEMACAHPNWSMGQKISVDSATMMNKGLEFIEACWLFDCGVDDIEIVVHPESIIHSMVQFKDGSTLAQLGQPDMRTPIAHTLAWPKRIDAGVKALDMFAVGQLNFKTPDEERFPALRLAKQAMRDGLTAPAILNAANEVAVDAFLHGQLRFDQIVSVCEKVLAESHLQEPTDIEMVIAVDQQARQSAKKWIAQW